MARGPGVYDAECKELMDRLEADTVIVAVQNGRRGNGFSVNSTDPGVELALPSILRNMAKAIEDERCVQ